MSQKAVIVSCLFRDWHSINYIQGLSSIDNKSKITFLGHGRKVESTYLLLILILIEPGTPVGHDVTKSAVTKMAGALEGLLFFTLFDVHFT